MLFALMTLGPAAAIVLVDCNGGGVLPALVTVVWCTRSHAFRWLNVMVLAVSAAIVIG